MKRWRIYLRGLGVFGLFAAAGPLIGGFLFGLVLVVQGSNAGSGGFVGTLTLPLLSAVLGYLAGLAPAAFTGAVGAIISRWVAGDRLWIGLCAGIGAASSWVNLVPLQNGYPSDNPGLLTVVQVVLLGAVAALACAWFCRGFRPLPRRRLRPSGSG